MATQHAGFQRPGIAWTGSLVRRLRGKRTQAQFGALLRVPKNTVWRWESDRVTPDAQNARRLARLAERERFLKDWRVAGSLKVEGDIEQAARRLSTLVLRSLRRTARRLVG